ncbi:MAG: primosomal protein N' [Actinomycetota bacterium]|nr:primosomal protein N' [Actinomycetota bacterium]
MNVGTLVRVGFGGRTVRGIVTTLTDAAPDRELDPIKGVVAEMPVAPAPLVELYDWLAERYVVPRGKAFARATPPRVRVKVGTDGDGEVSLDPITALHYQGGRQLIDAIEKQRSGTFCFRVLPGEDRGRVVAELASAARRSHRTTIVAVPEVRYGSQVIASLAGHFPHLMRLDSAAGDAERSAGWLSMAAGSSLGAGGRSAVFAPSPELGLIVVVEEHHQTYKEDRSPRYHAVKVAVKRAGLQGAVCVLISPTPSVETGWAAASGTFASVVADRTERRAARPLIEVIERETDRPVSHVMHERIAHHLRQGDRVALLAPSGAFARAVWCAACRRSLRCPVCEAGLFFERSHRAVACARCGFRGNAPDVCPTCGAADFRFVGAGTERLGEQLTKSFPRARVVRVDPSNPADSGHRDADVYVTTWIGTKPELRPDVSLVGVLDADWLIRRPDFRASESAYQALVEMAEWAGPASTGGRLVVQSSDPSHHAIQALVRADYDFFLEREVEVRRELSYPPFTELIRLSARGPGARAALDDLIGHLPRHGIKVLGPVERGPARPGVEALLKCESADTTALELRGILKAMTRATSIAVDVDPR